MAHQMDSDVFFLLKVPLNCNQPAAICWPYDFENSTVKTALWVMHDVSNVRPPTLIFPFQYIKNLEFWDIFQEMFRYELG